MGYQNHLSHFQILRTLGKKRPIFQFHKMMYSCICTVGVDVNDVRAARLRRLATEKHNLNAENVTSQSRTEAACPVNRTVTVSSDKGTARRRLNDKSEASKGNTDKTGGSETSKRLDKSRLLSPSIKHTEDCQPQLPNVKERSPVTVEMAAPTGKAAVSERSPVTTTVDANDTMIFGQRVVTDDACVIDLTDAQKELSTVPLHKSAGTCITSYT